MKRERSHLLGRLKNIQAQKRRESETSRGKRVYSALESLGFLKGWERLEELVYHKRTVFPGTVDANPISSGLMDPLLREKKFVFFDTETTGLSGGAGTIIFLIGLGTIHDDAFVVDQYFLADFPGEPAFLSVLNSNMDESSLYISYNGKSFDSPLLKTRCIMNGMIFSISHQLDLLYLSRRLWKDILDSCSLGSIEEGVLGIAREQDLPGYLIPQTYFSYLKNRDAGQLEKVFTHNLQDIVSLSKLFNQINTILLNPLESTVRGHYGLGRLLWEQGDPRGLDVLDRSFKAGDMRAGRLLGLACKRRQHWEAAVQIWKQMWQRARDPAAGVELAKYYEHRSRECSLAILIVEEMLNNANTQSPGGKSLLHRLGRLNTKLASL